MKLIYQCQMPYCVTVLYLYMFMGTSSLEQSRSVALVGEPAAFGDVFNGRIDISGSEEVLASRYRRSVDQELINSVSSSHQSELTTQSGAISEPLPDTGLTSESTTVRTISSEPVSETLISSEPTSVTGPSSEPIPETGPTSEPIPETGPTPEPIPETGPTLEPIPDTGPTSEPIPDTGPTSEHTPETGPTSEPIPETGLTSEPMPEIGPTSEPIPDTGPTSKPFPENGATSEPSPDTRPTREPIPETGPTSEHTPETGPTSEPIPETGLTSEPMPETGPTSEPSPENGLTSEPIQDTGPTLEPKAEIEPTPERFYVTEPASETIAEIGPKSEPLPEVPLISESEPERSPRPESEQEYIPEPEGNPEPEQGMNISSEPSPEPGPSVKTDLFVAILSILILIILTTNITLIFTILKTKTLRKPTNVMILSLAFADISIACFVIPGVISAQFSELWMAIIICKICHFVSHMSLAAASFSLVAIALDRLRAIALPLKPKLSMSESGIVVAVTWFLSILYGLRAPFLFTITPVHVLNDVGELYTRMVCGVPESESGSNAPLVVLDFIIVFALPALTILTSYVGLLYFISKNTLRTQFVKPDAKRNTKALRLSILMISMFIVCHLPVHSLRLYISRVSSVIPETFDMIRAFDIISFMNSVLDPIVYGFLNKQIRDGFLERIGKSKTGQVNLAHNRIHPGGVSNAMDISKITTVFDSGTGTSVTRLPLP